MSGSVSGLSFAHIPKNQRVPGVGIEFSTARNNGGAQNLRALLIGQVLPGSVYAQAPFVNTPQLAVGGTDAAAKAGAGSQLALMVAQFTARNSANEFWVLPLVDDPASVAATGSFAIGGTATGSGTLPLYVDGMVVAAAVAPGMTGTQAAAAALANSALVPNAPVTFAASNGTLTATAKNKGAAGNDIDLRVAYRGTQGGEAIPPGLTVAVTPMAGGATNPALATALLSLADMRFEVIVSPYTDGASLDALGQLMDENTGRWNWSRKLYGMVYAAKRATLAQATTFGTTRNDPHVSVMPVSNCPVSPARLGAEIGAAVLERVSADPARPLQFLPTNILPPAPADRFAMTDRQVLLFDGLSTYKVVSGVFELERMVTTYQQNAAGSPDDSYLDCETMHTLGYVCRDLDAFLTQQFIAPGFKLVNDNVRIAGGTFMCNPKVIKASLDSRYRYLCDTQGVCQDPDGFVKESTVTAIGGGRVNIYAPIRLAGQLRFMAILVAFNKPT